MKLFCLLMIILYFCLTNLMIARFLFFDKVGARHPVNIELENNPIEVVPEFNLLGCTIDDKLRFDKHVKKLKSAVCK